MANRASNGRALGLVGGVAGFLAILYSFLNYLSRNWYGGGGEDPHDDIDGYRDKKVKYYVTDPEEGAANDELVERLKRKIEEYGHGATVEYIGITSGSDPETAMKSRVDSKKRRLEINEMRLLYKTTIRDNCTRVESQLIEHSRAIHGSINQNERKGAGGRRSEAAYYYYVYAAYKKDL